MDLQSVVALTTLPGISNPRAAAVFRELREHLDARWLTLERVVSTLAPGGDIRTIVAAARAEAADLLASAERVRVAPVAYSDAAYPPLLHAISDPPPVIWARGSLAALTRPADAAVRFAGATPFALDDVEPRLGEPARPGP